MLDDADWRFIRMTAGSGECSRLGLRKRPAANGRVGSRCADRDMGDTSDRADESDSERFDPPVELNDASI